MSPLKVRDQVPHYGGQLERGDREFFDTESGCTSRTRSTSSPRISGLVGGQNVPAVGSASILNSTNGLAIVVDVLVVRLGVVRTVVVVVGRGVVVVVVEVVVVGIRISVPGE